MDFYGGVEAGGTKIKCIIASDPEHILAQATFPTLQPENTLPKVVDFFKSSNNQNSIDIKGLGLAFFGPLDLSPSSPGYGTITSTPKLRWQSFPVLAYFKERFKCEIRLDTDVNAAALGEGKWGAARGLVNFIYITVGAGIGGGVLIDNKLIQSWLHTEVGHTLIQRHPEDSFPGICPFHANCIEGLASGPSLAERWQVQPASIPPDHAAWELESYYLAQFIQNLVLTCCPERILLGGGVMNTSGLLEKVQKKTIELLESYLQIPKSVKQNFIVAPQLGDNAGVLGAVALIRTQEH